MLETKVADHVKEARQSRNIGLWLLPFSPENRPTHNIKNYNDAFRMYMISIKSSGAAKDRDSMRFSSTILTLPFIIVE